MMHSDRHKPNMGILKLEQGEKKFLLMRYAPAEALRAFIGHYWIVSWDLTDEEPFVQEVVPNPCVNLVIESCKTYFYGPAKQRFSYPVPG